MELQDILFLIAAIAAWVISSYRKFSAGIPRRPETKPVIQQDKSTSKKPSALSEVQRKRSGAERTLYKKPDQHILQNATDEQSSAQRFWDETLKKEQQEQLTSELYRSDAAAEITAEIHSGNVDWRKAVILNTILRPVYF
jgi:hypothetical protein